jgi:hypothetical protein
MTILHLGVVDIPYASAPQPTNAPRIAKAAKPTKSGQPRKVRAKKHGPWKPGMHVESGEQTTGDVAQWLENKYHVMEAYFAINAQKIGDELAESRMGALENEMMGAPVGQDPYAGAMEDIDQGFRDFLTNDGMAQLGLPGVPTEAALRGVNHRLKIKKGAPRPSFIDTGNYQASFKAWTE